MKCLEKDRDLRYQSRFGIRTDLQAVEAGHGEREKRSYDSRGGTQSHFTPKAVGMVAGAGAVLIVGAVFLAWHSLHSRTSDATPIHSIAVLPFANAGKDPEMDYLGEGISEEITNSLSRLPNLQVMARSTVSHYISRQDDPRGVGHDLHVDAVLTGRVVEHGSKVDVETELVNVATGTQLWGERYTRSANDVSLIQAVITRDIASQLRPQLSGTEREKLAKVGTKDAEAYKFYLEGRYRLEKLTDEDYKAAAEFFDKAVAKDPNYAAAYAGLADVYTYQAYYGYSLAARPFDKARTLARRALELDPQNPEAHISLASVDMFFFRNFPEADTEIRKALALDPSSAYGHQVSCWFEPEMGRAQEAIMECHKAVELDPLSLIYNNMLGKRITTDVITTMPSSRQNKTLEIDPK